MLCSTESSIKDVRTRREGGWQMRAPVLILPLKGQILRTWGRGGSFADVRVLYGWLLHEIIWFWYYCFDFYLKVLNVKCTLEGGYEAHINRWNQLNGFCSIFDRTNNYNFSVGQSLALPASMIADLLLHHFLMPWPALIGAGCVFLGFCGFVYGELKPDK